MHGAGAISDSEDLRRLRFVREPLGEIDTSGINDDGGNAKLSIFDPSAAEARRVDVVSIEVVE